MAQKTFDAMKEWHKIANKSDLGIEEKVNGLAGLYADGVVFFPTKSKENTKYRKI